MMNPSNHTPEIKTVDCVQTESTRDYLEVLMQQPGFFRGSLELGLVHIRPGAHKALEAFHYLVSNNNDEVAEKLTRMMVTALDDSRNVSEMGEKIDSP